MSDEKALEPIDQRTVDFYGDSITAVLVQADDQEQVYVPIRPICDFLGVDWSSQRRRIVRDPVLAEVAMSVVITATDIDLESRRPRTSAMLALPLSHLNGWLFGISVNRVKEGIRDDLIRYQRDCYHVLYRAFLERAETAVTPTIAALQQIRDNSLAIAALAEQQIEHERMIQTAVSRLDQAARVVGELGKRVRVIEQRTAPGQPIGEEQAAEISQQVKALAMLLTEQDSSKNHYQGIFGELHRRFGVTGYKNIQQGKYAAVLAFLEDWRERAAK